MSPAELAPQPRSLELGFQPDPLILALNPENKRQLSMTRAVDISSQEAYNPFKPESHDPMTTDELKDWMKGDHNHMLRFHVVKSEEYGNYVNLDTFDKTVAELRDESGKNKKKIRIDRKQADSLERMRRDGVVGETYIYNDTMTDPDEQRRAQIIRESQGLPSNAEVCEINPWYVPGAKDAAVEQGVRSTLREFFSTRVRQTTAVYFADAADAIETHREATGARLLLSQISEGSEALASVTAEYQDARVLDKIGFRYGGNRIRYSDDSKFLDIPYVMVLTKSTVL